MYVVVANVIAGPGNREALTHALQASLEGSRAEDGCISYVFTSDIENPDDFSSIEVWQSKDALLAHLGGPGVATLLGALGPLVAGPPTITGYESGEPEKLA